MYGAVVQSNFLALLLQIAAISRSGSVQIPNIEDKIESLSFIRHSTSTFLDRKQTDCKMNRNVQRKLIQYARRLNDGRLDWELSRKRIERLQEKMVRNAMIAGLCIYSRLHHNFNGLESNRRTLLGCKGCIASQPDDTNKLCAWMNISACFCYTGPVMLCTSANYVWYFRRVLRESRS